MFRRMKVSGFSGVLALVIMIGLLAVAPGSVSAHCDSESGPVAAAARGALETGDVSLILPYAGPEYEAELTGAFERALEVRATSDAARELADRYFVETAVRVHRQTEGASFTGLTNEETPEIIQLADGAMASGALEDVYGSLNEALHGGLEARYQAVVAAREHAAHENTVAAHRERVEAELGFELYVYALSQALNPGDLHGGAVEGAGHSHK